MEKKENYTILERKVRGILKVDSINLILLTLNPKDKMKKTIIALITAVLILTPAILLYLGYIELPWHIVSNDLKFLTKCWNYEQIYIGNILLKDCGEGVAIIEKVKISYK